MADSGFWSNILGIILGVLIIIGFLYIVFFTNIPGTLRDLLPDFKKSEHTAKWEEEFFLENPELIVYYIDGREANIYLRYDKQSYINPVGEETVIGWSWSKDNEKWFSAEKRYVSYQTSGGAIRNIENKYLNEKNKKFLEKLEGQSPEKGLKLIVERVLINNEGNRFFNVKLKVFIGNWKEEYNAKEDARFLSDIDGAIDKFNQVSRGVIKQRR